MAHSKETISLVRTSYVRNGLPLRDAAKLHGVSYNTARTWKTKAAAEKDDWDNARAASQLAQSGSPEITAAFMDDFVRIFHDAVNGLREMGKDEENFDPIVVAEALSKMADAWAKTHAVLAKGQPTLNKLSVGFEVLQHFNDFIREYNPELAPEFIQLLEPFSEYLSQKVG